MSCLLMILGLALGVMGQEQPSPFGYVLAKAYHIPPETTTEESGYFSLCEGADGKTAYLQLLNDLRMFKIDLSGDAGVALQAIDLGNRIQGENPDSRGSISIGSDGQVYSVVRIDNKTGFGSGYVHHLIRHDSASGKMVDMGVLAITNPEFFDFSKGPGKNEDGTPRPTHGFHRLPDGTLTPLHVVLAMIVARDGTIYATSLYPFTLMRIEGGR
jgi:hypothetical protein